jgi:uncharacterized protein (TIGR02453 family)
MTAKAAEKTTTPNEFLGFGSDIVAFYSELESNNNKLWWEANKKRYESSVRAPLTALMETIAPEFGAAKLYRPHRDTRFSADKTPYKTNASASVFGKSGTGYYLEISARGIEVGGGYWMPGRDQLERFRTVVDDNRNYGDLEATVEELESKGFELYQQDALKTAPKGFATDHPRIHFLRLKHLVVGQTIAPQPWLYEPAAAQHIAELWRDIRDWNDWLVSMVGPTTEPERTR